LLFPFFVLEKAAFMMPRRFLRGPRHAALPEFGSDSSGGSASA